MPSASLPALAVSWTKLALAFVSCGIVPVDIVTNRDLVVEIIAPELDWAAITAGDIMLRQITAAG